MNYKIWAFACAFCVSVGLGGAQAWAETCGGIYKVQSGDSLSLIADRQYKNADY